MSPDIKSLLFEAYRRNDIADSHERSKPMTKRWLGLGTKSAYAPAIKAGIMVFHDGKEPGDRIMGWLCLTDKGLAAYRQLEGEFAEHLKFLKNETAYPRTVFSRFSLAGGLK
jgi:hypothetical protein